MADVNRARPGQTRRDRARATRRRMLSAAYELFGELGYVPTTMDAIAARAGVAVQTVKFTFHTKGQLLAELIAVTAAGPDEGTPVLDRAWVKDAEAAPDGKTVIALIVEHGSEIYRRLAPLSAAIETAASIDPDVAAHQRAIRDSRRRGMSHLIDVLAAKGALRHDLDRQDATDVLFVLQSPETYLAFVTHCGWTLDKWKNWQLQLLCDQLLDH